MSEMRHLDPRGDFGRNDRQRQVIEGIINKASSISSVTRFTSILSALGDNVKMNMTFDDMMNIQTNYRDCSTHIEQYEVKGNDKKINGIYYLGIPQEEQSKVSAMLKANLNEQ